MLSDSWQIHFNTSENYFEISSYEHISNDFTVDSEFQKSITSDLFYWTRRASMNISIAYIPPGVSSFFALAIKPNANKM